MCVVSVVEQTLIRIIPIFLLSLIPFRQIHLAKITIIMVIFGLTPYDRNPKPHRTDFAFSPKAQRFCTMFVHFVGTQGFSWSPNLISSFGRISHLESVFCHHTFTTNVAKYTCIVSALPSLSAHFYYFLIYSFIQDNVTKFSCK